MPNAARIPVHPLRFVRESEVARCPLGPVCHFENRAPHLAFFACSLRILGLLM